MKKLIPIILFILLLFSCKKEDEMSSYQIINNKDYSPSSIDYLDGTMWVVAIDYYNGSDIIHTDSINKISPAGGKSHVKIIVPSCEKILVSFKDLPPESPRYPLSDRWYVGAFKIIEKGKNNIVTVENETRLLTYSSSTDFINSLTLQSN